MTNKLLLIVGLALCHPIFAFGPKVDLFGGTGFSTATGAPSLLQFSFGASFGVPISNVFTLGIRSDYRRVSPLSDKDPVDLAGTRWCILAPYVEYELKEFRLSLDIQFLGDYSLNDRIFAYTSPLGARLTASRTLVDQVDVGVFFELVQFSQQRIGPQVSDLTQTFNLWQSGVFLNFRFSGTRETSRRAL